jgi:hypothetical protein
VTNMSYMFNFAGAFNRCLSPWAKKLDRKIILSAIFYDSGCEYSEEPTYPFTNPGVNWCGCEIQ